MGGREVWAAEGKAPLVWSSLFPITEWPQEGRREELDSEPAHAILQMH